MSLIQDVKDYIEQVSDHKNSSEIVAAIAALPNKVALEGLQKDLIDLLAAQKSHRELISANLAQRIGHHPQHGIEILAGVFAGLGVSYAYYQTAKSKHNNSLLLFLRSFEVMLLCVMVSALVSRVRCSQWHNRQEQDAQYQSELKVDKQKELRLVLLMGHVAACLSILNLDAVNHLPTGMIPTSPVTIAEITNFSQAKNEFRTGAYFIAALNTATDIQDLRLLLAQVNGLPKRFKEPYEEAERAAIARIGPHPGLPLRALGQSLLITVATYKFVLNRTDSHLTALEMSFLILKLAFLCGALVYAYRDVQWYSQISKDTAYNQAQQDLASTLKRVVGIEKTLNARLALMQEDQAEARAMLR